jgi:divalent metal cation (Fe/Co/Zn/Cd) transporter
MSEDIQQGLRVSGVSLIWTLCSGAAAIAIGILSNSLVLAVFGCIGLLDALGSATLIFHFSRAIRHEAISESYERLALLVVTGGMGTIGVATVADSAYRLTQHSRTNPFVSGIVLAGVSVVVLAGLAVRKQQIARRIPSHALHADGWLSALGAILACITLAGMTLNTAFGWWWVDPAAAIAVACGAVALSGLLATR